MSFKYSDFGTLFFGSSPLLPLIIPKITVIPNEVRNLLNINSIDLFIYFCKKVSTKAKKGSEAMIVNKYLKYFITSS